MASWKWLIRGLFLVALAVCAAGGFLLYVWMRPEFVRTQLTTHLLDRLNNTDIEVNTARLRILGGISVYDLKLIRHDDPTRTPVLAVPSAVLHHDKERLNEGQLIIRKIEMFKPRLRIERDAAGKWNLAEILKPPRDDEPVPIFILHQATITFVDRRLGDQPLVEWTDVEATIINDPLPVFTFNMTGRGAATGPFALTGRFDSRAGLGGSLDLPDIPLGPPLAKLAEAYSPEAGAYLTPLGGTAAVHLDVVYRTGKNPVLQHDLQLQLKQARYEHANLPLSFTDINAKVRSRNGDVRIEEATARAGQGTVSLTADLPRDPPHAPRSVATALPSATRDRTDDPSPLESIEDRLRSLEVAVTNMHISPEVFDRLPPKAGAVRDMFMPNGPFSATFSFVREEGGWRKKLVIDPLGMDATYRGFPYPLRNVRGRVTHAASNAGPDVITIDLKGDGACSTVDVGGTIRGTHPEMDVDLTIKGKGVVLDDKLIAAMPDDQPEVLRKLHATATGDFVGLIRHNERIRREYGPDVFANEFTIDVRDATMRYEEFPFPLENMTGQLFVKTVPDRPTRLPIGPNDAAKPQNGDVTTLEFRHFRATRRGATVRGSGRKDPAPGGSVLTLNVDAEALALDEDFANALAAIRVDNAWRNFNPSGRVNLSVRTKLYARSDKTAPLNPTDDLELSVAFAGGQVKPRFFPYVLHDLAGQVSYAKGRVEFRDFKGRHGQTEVGLPTAEVLFRPSGGYWADLRDLRVNPLVIDEAFKTALPPGLKSACEGLALRGPVALHAARMVIDEQPGPFLPRNLPDATRAAVPEVPEIVPVGVAGVIPKPILPTIYWDGRLILAGAAMSTGVDWEDVHGTVASWGLYKGDHLGAVRGNISFDRAKVAAQPLEAVTASLRVDPRNPDVLAVPAIRGKLYGGDVGGEAWVMMESEPRYALQLNAARIRLGDIARQYRLPPRAHLEGLASAELYLSSKADERTGKSTVQGGGTIDVPKGKMLNLPVFLNLIKVVKLRVPDDTGFEEAHATFYLRGDRVKFGQLDLIGNAVSLGGEGEMKADGSQANFEFYPVWTKVKEMFALPGDWTGAISKRFLKIRVTGDLNGSLDYKAEPVPGIVDPVKRVFERLK